MFPTMYPPAWKTERQSDASPQECSEITFDSFGRSLEASAPFHPPRQALSLV